MILQNNLLNYLHQFLFKIFSTGKRLMKKKKKIN